MEDELFAIVEELRASGASDDEIGTAIKDYESTGVVNNETLGKAIPLQDTHTAVTVQGEVQTTAIEKDVEPQSLDSSPLVSSSDSPKLELNDKAQNIPLSNADWAEIEIMRQDGADDNKIQEFITNKLNDRVTYAENIERSSQIDARRDGGGDLDWLKAYGDLEGEALELYANGHSRGEVYTKMEDRFYQNKNDFIALQSNEYLKEGNKELPSWYYKVLETPAEERDEKWWGDFYFENKSSDIGGFGDEATLWKSILEHDAESYNKGYDVVAGREVDLPRGLPTELLALPAENWNEANDIYNEQGFPGVLNYVQKKAADDEAFESTLENIYPGAISEVIGLDYLELKNLSDAYENIATTARGAYPNARFYSSRLSRFMFGDEAVDDFVDENGEGSFWTEGLSDAQTQEDWRTIQLLNAQQKDSTEFLESLKDGNLTGVLTSMLSAPSHLGSSYINAMQTFGLSFFSDIFAGTYTAVNEVRAEQNNTTVDELISSGNDSIGLPLAFATPAALLEFAGGFGQAKGLIKIALGKQGLKQAAKIYFKSNSGEGITEILQFGLDEAAVALERTGDGGESAKAFFGALASQEGWENFFQGFFAGGTGGAVIGGVKARNSYVRDKKNIEKINGTLEEISNLQNKIDSGKPSKGDTKLLREVQARLKEEIKELYFGPMEQLKDAPEANQPDIDAKLEEIENIYKETNKAEFSESIDNNTFKIVKKANETKIQKLQDEILKLAEPKELTTYGKLKDTALELIKDPKKIKDEQIDILESAIGTLEKQNEKTREKNKKVLAKKEGTAAEVEAENKAYKENKDTLVKAKKELAKIKKDKGIARDKIKTEREARLKKEGKVVDESKTDAQIAAEAIASESKTHQGTTEKQPSKSKKKKVKAKPAPKYTKKTPTSLKKASPSYGETTTPAANEQLKADKVDLENQKKELESKKKEGKGTKRLEKQIAKQEEAIADKETDRLEGREQAESLVDLGNNPRNKQKAKKLASKVTKNAKEIVDHITDKVSSKDAKIALDNVIAAINQRADLTKEEKAKIIADLRTNTKLAATQKAAAVKQKAASKKSNGRVVEEENPIDDSEVSEFDDITHDNDVDTEIENFGETVKNVGKRKKIDKVDNTKDEIDAKEAVTYFENKVTQAKEYIADKWHRGVTRGVKVALRTLSAETLHSLVAEGITGTVVEDFDINSTPANKALVRLGRLAYQQLKTEKKDVSQFHIAPPDILEQLQALGLTDEDIESRILNLNLMRAGGAMVELIGGADGFIEYGRGYPSPSRHMDLRFNILDLEGLRELGFVDILTELKKTGAIELPSDWYKRLSNPESTKDQRKSQTIAVTIVDKLAFKELMGSTVDPDGYTVFQNMLAEGHLIAKWEDYNEAEITTTRVTDKEGLAKYSRGAALSVGKVSDQAAKHKGPLGEKPGRWTSFVHANGLEAVTNASAALKKLFKEGGKKALQGLSNAARQAYQSDERTLAIFNAVGKDIYKDKPLKLAELERIRDEAGKWLTKDFYIMHFHDWRGRMYNGSKYFNFQSSKISKAIHRFGGARKAIGKNGFSNLVKQLGDYLGTTFYLMEDGSISFDPKSGGKEIDSKAMTDKDRFRVGMKLVVLFANAAADPTSKESKELFKQAGDVEDVISLASEMLQLVEYVQSTGNDVTTYESRFILWNDATVSGAQNLGMLVQDPITLALVNGLDSYQKKDLYRKVGNKVFGSIPVYVWTSKDQKALDGFNEELDAIEKKLKDEKWKGAKIARAYKAEYTEIVEGEKYNNLAEKYWGSAERQDFVRKLAKGPVMTGFYSAGYWVMAEDLVKDFKDEVSYKDGVRSTPFEGIHHGTASWLTKRLKKATSEIAPGAKLAQSTFNSIATAATEADQLINLTGAVNNFPFLQEYLKFRGLRNAQGKEESYPVKVNNPGQASLRFSKIVQAKVKIGESHPDKVKIGSATAPNITHFLDGQVVASQYTDQEFAKRAVATVHDNFGTHPSDADAQVASVLDSMAKMYSVIENSETGLEESAMERLIKEVLAFSPALADKEIKKYKKNRAKKIVDSEGKEIYSNPDDIKGQRYAISSAGGEKRYTHWLDGKDLKDMTPNERAEAQFEAQLEEMLVKKGIKQATKDDAGQVKDDGIGCAI